MSISLTSFVDTYMVPVQGIRNDRVYKFSFVGCFLVMKREKNVVVENPGIDPGTSRMLSERSTI